MSFYLQNRSLDSDTFSVDSLDETYNADDNNDCASSLTILDTNCENKEVTVPFYTGDVLLSTVRDLQKCSIREIRDPKITKRNTSIMPQKDHIDLFRNNVFYLPKFDTFENLHSSNSAEIRKEKSPNCKSRTHSEGPVLTKRSISHARCHESKLNTVKTVQGPTYLDKLKYKMGLIVQKKCSTTMSDCSTIGDDTRRSLDTVSSSGNNFLRSENSDDDDGDFYLNLISNSSSPEDDSVSSANQRKLENKPLHPQCIPGESQKTRTSNCSLSPKHLARSQRSQSCSSNPRPFSGFSALPSKLPSSLGPNLHEIKTKMDVLLKMKAYGDAASSRNRSIFMKQQNSPQKLKSSAAINLPLISPVKCFTNQLYIYDDVSTDSPVNQVPKKPAGANVGHRSRIRQRRQIGPDAPSRTKLKCPDQLTETDEQLATLQKRHEAEKMLAEKIRVNVMRN